MEVLLASLQVVEAMGRGRPGRQLNVLQHAGQRPRQATAWPEVSGLLELRNLGLGEER